MGVEGEVVGLGLGFVSGENEPRRRDKVGRDGGDGRHWESVQETEQL